MISSRYDFEAIGTRWSIGTAAPIAPDLLSWMHIRIDAFDATYSRFRPDSSISRFATTGGVCELPDDAVPILDFYRRLYEVTGGSISPLVGGALEHLGYDRAYSLRRRPGSLTVPDWDDTLTVDGPVLCSSEPVLIDVGAAGKGYLVDLVAQELSQAGLDEYLVDGGGDIYHLGDQDCPIGLEHPSEPGAVIGVAHLRQGALCGSAVNRRAWGEGLHHIIDPATGEPTTGTIATWVAADSAMVADGLSTALFLTEASNLADQFAFSYVRMPTSGGVEYSTDFDWEIFT